MPVTEVDDARVPPGAAPLNAAQLRDWVKAAQPNARLIYGYGGVVAHCCHATVAEAVRTLAKLGYVTPHRSKIVNEAGGSTVIQLVQRTGKPFLKGAALEEPKEPKYGTKAERDAAMTRRLFGQDRSRDREL